jgi:hypothetical protein
MRSLTDACADFPYLDVMRSAAGASLNRPNLGPDTTAPAIFRFHRIELVAHVNRI